MSKPKRYQPVVQCVEPSYQAQMIEPKVMEFSEGEYVRYEDYARLKAEVEKWEKNTQLMGRQLNDELEQVARLKAEVENSKRINTELLALSNRQASDIRRLTKAGDAMAEIVNGTYCIERPQALKDWNESKMAILMAKTVDELAAWHAAKGVQS